MSKRIQAFYKTAIAALSVLLLSVPMFVDPFLSQIFIEVVIAILLSYLIIFYNQSTKDRGDFLIKTAQIVVPLLVVGSIILMWAHIDLIVWLGAEDQWLEIFQPILLFASALLFLGITISSYAKRSRAIIITSLIGAIVLFIMGMEEISWMQRIIGVESTGLFLERNMQQETNLHNFSSIPFNVSYLVVAFLLLVIAPYYRETLIKLLGKFNLEKLRVFMPSRWLFMASVSTVGILNVPHASIPLLVLIMIFATVLLAKESYRYYQAGNMLLSVWCISLITLIVLSYITAALGPMSNLSQTNAVFEFRETFITIGIIMYTLDTFVKANKKQSVQK